MSKHILFLHGGASKEDFNADAKLVNSLKSNLGPGFLIDYPFLPNDGTPDLGRRKQIEEKLSKSQDGVIIVAHSLGASMLLAVLSESKIMKPISAIFFLSTPFWTGSEEWVNAFKLQPDFASRIDKRIPLFFYQTRDDQEVPFTQFEIYKRELPWATFRELPNGGHQLNNDLSLVAEDLNSIVLK